MARHFDCPNCGASLEIPFIRLARRWKRKSDRPRSGQFEQTADLLTTDPPRSLLGSAWYFLVRGGKYSRPFRPAHITVRSEIKTSPQQMLINELELPATESEIAELADLYIRRGESWARDRTTAETSLSQYSHNKVKNAFVALRFLEEINYNRYELTDAGRRFLRHYL